jgi:hypothetical protein
MGGAFNFLGVEKIVLPLFLTARGVPKPSLASRRSVVGPFETHQKYRVFCMERKMLEYHLRLDRHGLMTGQGI